MHNGVIKIADFGFARFLEEDDVQASTYIGSPFHMVFFKSIRNYYSKAPEILDGKKYDNKADIWSLGTILYEMLFGMPPFTSNNLFLFSLLIKDKNLI